MANDKKFIAKNGFLTADAESSFTSSTQATSTLTVTNTGGDGTGTATGAVIAEFIGDSDAIRIQNINGGDYGIYNTQQINGIELYDGTGGVRLVYNGNSILEIDSAGSRINQSFGITGQLTADKVVIEDDGSSSPLLRIRSDDASPWAFEIGNDTYTTSTSGLMGYQNDSGHFWLDVRGDAQYRAWYFRQHNGSSPIQTMTFDTSGDVGINTDAPSEKLDVNGIIHTRQYFQKPYNSQEIWSRAQDSGGNYSLFTTINDGQGNYNIMAGVNGAGQVTTSNYGAGKILMQYQSQPGVVSLNAADDGTTAGNNVNYTVGLMLESSTNAIYVGNPSDNIGLYQITDGYKIAENNGTIYGTDIQGDLSYTSPGQIALSRANNNPYLSFHNASGGRKGYIQHTGNDLYIANETTGEFFFTGGTTVADPPRLVINASSQQTTAPGDMYGQIQFRVSGAAGVNASGLNGTDGDTIAMIAAQDFRNGSGKTNEDSGLGFYTSQSGTAMTYRGGISNQGKWFIGTWNNDNNGDSTALLNVNGSIYAANEVYASAATGWTEYGNISSVYYDQDNITINHTGSSAYNALVYGNSTYVNFKASVLFRTSNSDHWGIMFRGQASNPHDNSLQVIVRGSTLDDVRVQQRVAGVQTYLLPGSSGTGTAVPNPDDGNWHLLEVQVYGNNIIVKIDGTVYISSTSLATQYSSGGTVGLTTYTANGTVDFKSFRVENLSGNTVQGPVEQYADIDMNDNDITNIGRLNFINHEGSDYGVTGDVMFDENFNNDTEYGSADNWPGGDGGGLAVYNQDGWGRIITDRNMQWLSAHFYGIGISPNSSADPSSRISALNIGGNDTAVFAGSDALYDKDHNAFINIANYSETNNVEAGIVLRAKSTGAGVHAMYVKHRGTGTTYQGDLRFRSRNTSTTSQDNMTIRYDGNVGIGTTDPISKLHVQSSANEVAVFETTLTSEMAIQLKNSQGSMYFGLDGSENFGVGTGWDLNNPTYGKFTVQSSGNVGVGSITPADKLDVAGTIRISDGVPTLKLYDTSNSYGGGSQHRILFDTTGGPMGFIGVSSTSEGTIEITNDPTHGEVTANTGTYNDIKIVPDGTLRVGRNNGYTRYMSITGVTETVANFQTNYDGTGSQQVSISKLDGNWLDGSTGSDTQYGMMFNYQNNARAGLVYDHRSTERLTMWSSYGRIGLLIPDSATGSAVPGTTTMNEALTVAVGGNIGIGTTNPGGKFDIYGTNGQLFTIVDSFTGTIFSANDGSGVPSIEVLDTGIVRLAEFAGNVLVGTNTDDGSNKLQVTGGIMATQDITAYASSDARLKTELQPIENALDKVNSLTGYTFNWNRAAQMNYGKDAEAREAGVIAQDVNEVLPEVTTTREDGYMAVKYEKMVPLLIEAIKEQQTQINQLTELVNKLTSEK